MTDSVFTREEMDALREELHSPAQNAPEDVDLAGSDRGFRGKARALERRLTLFAKSSKPVLAAALRCNCETTLDSTDVVGPQVAQEVLSSLVLTAELRGSDEGLMGYLGFDADLCFLLVERAFGGSGSPGQSDTHAARQELTSVEQQILWNLVCSVTETLQKSLATSDAKIQLRCSTSALDPEFPKDIENVLLVRLDTRAEQDSSTLTVLLLPNLVEESNLLAAKSPLDGVSEQLVIGQHLQRASIELSSILGYAEMSVADLLALRAGDIIRLDRSQADAIPILLEGSVKFLGQPVERHGVYGVEIRKEAP